MSYYPGVSLLGSMSEWFVALLVCLFRPQLVYVSPSSFVYVCSSFVLSCLSSMHAMVSVTLVWLCLFGGTQASRVTQSLDRPSNEIQDKIAITVIVPDSNGKRLPMNVSELSPISLVKDEACKKLNTQSGLTSDMFAPRNTDLWFSLNLIKGERKTLSFYNITDGAHLFLFSKRRAVA